MKKTVSLKYLREIEACSEGVEEYESAFSRTTPSREVLSYLIKRDHLDWANWLICRLMNKKERLAYAIYAAEQVIDIYEKKYPNNDQPRKAIEAAKAVLRKDTPKNRKAAEAAADAARAAAHAAYAAAYGAADAAYAAAYAAHAAYTAAYGAAADAAAHAAYAERKNMRLKILKFGMKFLEA